MNKALNIQIPEALHDRLKGEADAKGVSMAGMVRLICIEYFEKKDAGSGGPM